MGVASRSLLIAYLVYAGMTRKIRRRRRILAQPFPAEWEEILQREVVFFRALDPEDQARFRRELQVFLGEKLITGIRLELDTTTRVLAAASAVIPIFGFPEWEWDQISEVLVYPDRFDQDFAFEGDEQRNTLGMVGTGALNRLMILSKPDLLAGFRNPDGQAQRRRPRVRPPGGQVGRHHRRPARRWGSSGRPSGRGSSWCGGRWRRCAEGDSDINPYGLTNEAEFFAVATEYFFERPGVMERKHPELFAMLSKVFSQNLGERAAALARERKRGRPRFGRNSPCPCGSGVKYKKCCLDRNRRPPR